MKRRTFKPRSAKPKEPIPEELIRLNKFIANAGICSRRKADELIKKGLVKVNGKEVLEVGAKVTKKDIVSYQGKRVFPGKKVYILLNKPKDFISTTKDEHNRKTIMQLVKNATDERVYPVGRLDRNTTGLILITNDGQLAQNLAHPSKNIKKLYKIELDKPVSQQHFDKIKNGVKLEEGIAEVDNLAYTDDSKKIIGIEVHIGWNRVIRRIFESLGYRVKKLDRVIYAGLTKKNLTRGKWRYLSERELIQLKHFT